MRPVSLIESPAVATLAAASSVAALPHTATLLLQLPSHALPLLQPSSDCRCPLPSSSASRSPTPATVSTGSDISRAHHRRPCCSQPSSDPSRCPHLLPLLINRRPYPSSTASPATPSSPSSLTYSSDPTAAALTGPPLPPSLLSRFCHSQALCLFFPRLPIPPPATSVPLLPALCRYPLPHLNVVATFLLHRRRASLLLPVAPYRLATACHSSPLPSRPDHHLPLSSTAAFLPCLPAIVAGLYHSNYPKRQRRLLLPAVGRRCPHHDHRCCLLLLSAIVVLTTAAHCCLLLTTGQPSSSSLCHNRIYSSHLHPVAAT
ncbi:hypothetical protein BHM03_00035529 [Ensete ventricosum]|nr:hypothetical protein BHM03_00035529 [Ensete ventricosum]